MRLQIDLTYQTRLNWSLLRAGIPFIRSLSVRNAGAEATPALPLRLRVPLCLDTGEDALTVPRLEPGQKHAVTGMLIHVDFEHAVLIGYPRQQALRIKLGDNEVSLPVEVLLADEWLHGFQPADEPGDRNPRVNVVGAIEWTRARITVPHSSAAERSTTRDIWRHPPFEAAIAALVQPGHRVVIDLKHEALDDPANTPAEEAARRIYEALQRRAPRSRHDIEKISFEEMSQRIRLPHEIFLDDDRAVATCVDYALLFAAVLEAAGKDPVVIFTAERGLAHAMVGCWIGNEEDGDPPNLGFRHERESIIRDKVVFRGDLLRVDRAFPGTGLLPIDVTEFTRARGWTEACRAARRHLLSPGTDFLYAVDVRMCRGTDGDQLGIRPLPHATARPAAPADVVHAAIPQHGAQFSGLSHSVRFSSPLEAERGGKPIPPQSTQDALHAWLSIEPNRMLLLVCDFSADVRQTYNAIVESELLPDLTGWRLRPERPAHLPDIDALAPFAEGRETATILALDLSAMDDEPEGRLPDWWARIAEVWRSVRPWRRYKLMVCASRRSVPRHLGTDALMYVATPLFSKQHRPQADLCQAMVHGQARLGETLRGLVAANSLALSDVVARFLSNHGERWDPSPGPTNLDHWLTLSHELVHAGFVEIAFRLELACISAIMPADKMLLAADITSSDPDRLVGFVDDVRWVPRLVRRGWLAAGPGCGKSTALQEVERFWAIPRPGRHGLDDPCWLPLLISVDEDQDAGEGLVQTLRMRQVLFAGGRRFVLPCHEILAGWKVDRILRSLVSPIYVLVDGLDDPAGRRTTRFLDTLRSLNPAGEWGVLVASQIEISDDALALPGLPIHTVRIRPLDRARIAGIAGKRGGGPMVRAITRLYDRGDREVRTLLRTPQTLTWMCSSPSAGHGPAPDLREVVEDHVADIIPDASLMDWLSEQAFLMRVQRKDGVDTDHHDSVARARAAGVLRSHPEPGRVVFASALVSDFLAARHLKHEADARSRLQGVLRSGPGRARNWWRSTLAMLVRMLDPATGRDLLHDISESDPAMGAVCAASFWRGSTPGVADMEVLHSIAARAGEKDVGERIQILDALGALDPRFRNGAFREAFLPIGTDGSGTPVVVNRYPVTNLEFARFVRDGYRDSTFWTPAGWAAMVEYGRSAQPQLLEAVAEAPNHPVGNVCFHEAAAYCRWLSRQYRDQDFFLPTAVDWDRAALGGGTDHGFLTRWLFEARARLLLMDVARRIGDRSALGPRRAAEIRAILEKLREAAGQLVIPPRNAAGLPAGSLPPNDHGFFDLLGVHWEWCDSDASLDPDRRPSADDASPARPVVVKGGPFTGEPDPLLMILGGYFDPKTRFKRVGFRIAATVQD